jgi:inorganic phosphate transporter, PiT family
MPIMAHAQLFIIFSAFCSFFMAWGIGANDVANAMGTSVGSKTITLRQAVLIAVVFEIAGSLLAGGQVTDTIRSKIIDVHLLTNTPYIFVYGMLAALLAAGTWLVIATHFGWPVSTTHSIVGAVVGFGLIVLDSSVIHWAYVFTIAVSWVIAPILAGILSYALFRSVQKLIFEQPKPIRQAKHYVPIYIFITSFVIFIVTLISGLSHIGLHLTNGQNFLIAVLLSTLMAVIGRFALNRFHFKKKQTPNTELVAIEKIFSILMIFTACAMAFAHGSNDVANAIGPLAAIVGIVHSGGQITANPEVPVWILLLGGLGIIIGLSTYGYKIIVAVGSTITQMTPSRGFTAQLACASTVIFASGIGLPISTSHTLVGAILGVGFARGIGALNLNVVRNIFLSWAITLPAGAILAIIYFYLINIASHWVKLIA